MLWTVIALLAIVFVLTYDPKSRTLEKFVDAKQAPTKTEKECEDPHYNAVQFGQAAYECTPSNRVKMGAIVGA